MKNELNYQDRHGTVTVQIELENMRNSTIMGKHELKIQAASVDKMLEEITLLILQAPPLFRDDSHKVGCLRRALLGILSAQTSIFATFNNLLLFQLVLSRFSRKTD